MAIIEKIIYGEHSIRLELANGESLKLPYSAVSDYSLRSGMDITGEVYLGIYNDSLKFSCLQKGLAYLSGRSRSTHEMRVYLKKKII